MLKQLALAAVATALVSGPALAAGATAAPSAVHATAKNDKAKVHKVHHNMKATKKAAPLTAQ
jgi:hypothetical protein